MSSLVVIQSALRVYLFFFFVLRDVMVYCVLCDFGPKGNYDCMHDHETLERIRKPYYQLGVLCKETTTKDDNIRLGKT